MSVKASLDSRAGGSYSSPQATRTRCAAVRFTTVSTSPSSGASGTSVGGGSAAPPR